MRIKRILIAQVISSRACNSSGRSREWRLATSSERTRSCLRLPVSSYKVKPARKSVGGSREPKLSASSGVYGYQPQPRLPRRTAQDSGAGQRILCGTAVPPPAGPSAPLLRLGLLAAGGGGSGAADV